MNELSVGSQSFPCPCVRMTKKSGSNSQGSSRRLNKKGNFAPQSGLGFMIRIISIFTFFLALSVGAAAQEIVVNEYWNPSSQNDEWTELLVVKDDLDLRGWYIGDNNAATSSWQPKIRFKASNPFWNHLRAGTIIVLDHASGTDDSNCNDAPKYDYDKSDGFIRICVRNPDYFEGGSSTTLFLADGGDFVQLVNPSGKMVHGMGHDSSPGGSVIGTPCFLSSPNWTDISSANGDTPPCPTAPFTFWKVGLSAPTSLKMIAGILPEYSSGLLEAVPSAAIDSSDTAFEGIGNGQINNLWVIKLRAPDFEAQTVCPEKLPDGSIRISWNSMPDPQPSDQTCGYMVVRNNTGNFGTPPQGKEFAVGSNYGTGNQLVTVAAILDHTSSGTFAFSENPGPGTFYYRVFPFRYKNTPGFEHPTRGRAYNTEKYVKVNAESAPPYFAFNDTLCGPGLATMYIQPFAQPGPTGMAFWYDAPLGGNLIQSGKDTLRTAVTQTTSFWIEFPNGSWCSTQRVEIKALVKAADCPYLAPDSVCEGVPALLSGPSRSGLQYKWEILSSPPGVKLTPFGDSLKIETASTNRKEWVVYRVQCSYADGCESKSFMDSLYTIPLECSLFSEPETAIPGRSMLVSVNSSREPWQVGSWQLSSGEISVKSPVSLRFVPDSPDPQVKAEILILSRSGAVACKAIRNFRPGIPNLVIRDGLTENHFLSFGSRKLTFLRIYNRWGQLLRDYPGSYPENWPDTEVKSGIYYYEAGISGQSEALSGWVEVR